MVTAPHCSWCPEGQEPDGIDAPLNLLTECKRHRLSMPTHKSAPDTAIGLGSFERGNEMGDRATAFIEGIWCKKIRGCSYRGGNRSTAAQQNDKMCHAETTRGAGWLSWLDR